jgi:hypothetical protein
VLQFGLIGNAVIRAAGSLGHTLQWTQLGRGCQFKVKQLHIILAGIAESANATSLGPKSSTSSTRYAEGTHPWAATLSSIFCQYFASVMIKTLNTKHRKTDYLCIVTLLTNLEQGTPQLLTRPTLQQRAQPGLNNLGKFLVLLLAILSLNGSQRQEPNRKRAVSLKQYNTLVSLNQQYSALA